MKIINSHMHLGSCRVFDLDTPEEEVLGAMRKHGVTTQIVQPYPGAPNPVEVHGRIARMAKGNPGKIFGLVSLSPHMEEEKYRAEVEKLVKDDGFVAVKLHTIGHAVNPLGNSATKVFEAAKALKVPVMVHTGPGMPFSLPSLVIPRATQYPDVPIILAHAGWGAMQAAEVYATAKTCKNVCLEPSWCSVWEKGWFVKEFGADRVMLGSDLTNNISTELHQFNSLGLAEKDLEKCLYSTANRVFGLKV